MVAGSFDHYPFPDRVPVIYEWFIRFGAIHLFIVLKRNY